MEEVHEDHLPEVQATGFRNFGKMDIFLPTLIKHISFLFGFLLKMFGKLRTV